MFYVQVPWLFPQTKLSNVCFFPVKCYFAICNSEKLIRDYRVGIVLKSLFWIDRWDLVYFFYLFVSCTYVKLAGSRAACQGKHLNVLQIIYT